MVLTVGTKSQWKYFCFWGLLPAGIGCCPVPPVPAVPTFCSPAHGNIIEYSALVRIYYYDYRSTESISHRVPSEHSTKLWCSHSLVFYPHISFTSVTRAIIRGQLTLYQLLLLPFSPCCKGFKNFKASSDDSAFFTSNSTLFNSYSFRSIRILRLQADYINDTIQLLDQHHLDDCFQWFQRPKPTTTTTTTTTTTKTATTTTTTTTCTKTTWF